VLLFDVSNGYPLAIVDAGEITRVRTAAVSGLATRLLARDDAVSLAILGTGTQGFAHLEAMLAVRMLKRIRVWDRQRASAERFAERGNAALGAQIDVVDTPDAAARDADIVCTTTGSREVILRGVHLAAGAHVNAVGACVPTARELDADAVRRSALFVDRRESALREAGDFLLAKQEGAVDDQHIRAELGDVVTGKHAGRSSGDEITLFKSLGLAVEDVAAAHHVYQRARELGRGTWIELASLRTH
jgi:ornithine cyclodeaminase